jgi:hypothetical protein
VAAAGAAAGYVLVVVLAHGAAPLTSHGARQSILLFLAGEHMVNWRNDCWDASAAEKLVHSKRHWERHAHRPSDHVPRQTHNWPPLICYECFTPKHGSRRREREREERQGRRFPYYAASPLRAAVAAAAAAAGSPSSLTPLSVASTWNQIYTRRQLVQRSEIRTCKIKAWGMDGWMDGWMQRLFSSRCASRRTVF